jgi:RNA 3'-terminal phosphate cyclase (ATP)
MQTVALPALFAEGPSRFNILGGTHVEWSPPYEYVRDVWLPLLANMGASIKIDLVAHGFYPAGGGEITMQINGHGSRSGEMLRSLDLVERGALHSVRGVALSANLPEHIAQRMADRACALLEPIAPHVDIRPVSTRAASPGAGIFLTAQYARVRAGFNAFGRRGKPSEAVAEEAVAALLNHANGGAALDRHLADQALLPLSLAPAPSVFTCEAVTRHLETNSWVIEEFGIAHIDIQKNAANGARVCVVPTTSAICA